MQFPKDKTSDIRGAPGRLFQKYVAGYIPPGIRRMMEPPTTKHFRWRESEVELVGHVGHVDLIVELGFGENIHLFCCEVNSNQN